MRESLTCPFLLLLLLALPCCGGKADAVAPSNPCASLDCDDGIPCTEDECTSSGKCTNTLKPGHCYILEQCAAAGESSSENDCRFCQPSVSTELWSKEDACCKALGSACPYQENFQCVLGDGARCQHESSGEVWVPPGVFWMGCNEPKDTACFVEETPQHKVELDSFAIDRTEVTVGAYAACVAEGACTEPILTTEGTWAQNDDFPVVGVNFVQAETYCAWADKAAGVQRLCTEAEWEKAARGGCRAHGCDDDDDACCGPIGPLYPWGDEVWTCNHVSLGAECGQPPYATVGKHPAGASAYGVLDLAGSVLELTSDWFAGDYYCQGADSVCDGPCDDCKGQPAHVTLWTQPTGPVGPLSSHSLRGGVAPPLKPRFRASYRDAMPPQSADAWTGFRCCRSVAPPL